MKYYVTSFCTFIVISFLSWMNPTSQPNQQITPEAIFETYKNNFNLFCVEVDELACLTTTSKETFDLPLLQSQILTTRLAFKRVEFIFDYSQTTYNYLFVNGAPLPKTHEDYKGIIPPNGLQTLDEIIFSDEATNQLDEIEVLSLQLKERVDQIASQQQRIYLKDRRMFEAYRTGIIRILALGLTGFDTPGSGNAIPEALVSLQSMEQSFSFFEKKLNPETEPLFLEISSLFRKGQRQLSKNDDFDFFDRMTFLKEIVNPLYAKLLEFQKILGVDLTTYNDQAINYKSNNLFNETAFNTDFYSFTSLTSLENKAAIQLGKLLFYDPVLSGNRDMSCATCHNPNKAFTDGLKKSKSNRPNVFTKRNTPTLIDAAYATRMFWDMREYNLERQVEHVVHDTLEFNIDFNEITKRLSKSETYTRMFKEIYGEKVKRPIYRRTISNAIAAYVNSLKSFNSEFDKYMREEISDYPDSAMKGFNLFMGKAACGTCHFMPVFNGNVPPFYKETESEVLGVTMGLDTINPQPDIDPGRWKNGLRRDAYPHFKQSFKTVSLRNVELTAPYMHNGLFKTLEDVMEFYDKGGGAGMGLLFENQTLSPDPLNLTTEEKTDIITFMKTLTDTTGLTSQATQLPIFENHPEWRN